MEYSKIKIDAQNPSFGEIVGYGNSDTPEVLVAGPGERYILGVKIDGTRFYVEGDEPKAKSLCAPAVQQAGLGDLVEIQVPKGTRATILDNSLNEYVATGIVEDGVVEVSSEFAGKMTVMLILPPGNYRYFSNQDLVVEFS